MTIDEAIKDLDIIRFNPHWDELVKEEYWQELMEMSMNAMKEVQQYHKLGTIEQCNEATKRAKAKKTIHRNGQHANCARCGQEVYVLDCYCRVCGQKLDWSDEK